MTTNENSNLSRRDALKTAGGIAVASAFAGLAIPNVHAAEDNAIRLALVGCGGREIGRASCRERVCVPV